MFRTSPARSGEAGFSEWNMGKIKEMRAQYRAIGMRARL